MNGGSFFVEGGKPGIDLVLLGYLKARLTLSPLPAINAVTR